MITKTDGLAAVLDTDLIGFVTAVNEDGQPQTSPVWYVRDGDELVVFNQPTAPRLRSIAVNPRVAFSLRADREGRSGVSLEALAARDDAMARAEDFPGYLDKYGDEIATLGWTPASFSDDYSVGIRLRVVRVRVWGLSRLDPSG